MYLEHFGLEQLPFTLTPNTQFYCNLTNHQAVLNVLLYGLNNGEGFVKIIGEVGTGKTLLCRKLLNALDDRFYVAYIPNPDLSPYELRIAVARELGVDCSAPIDSAQLNQKILERVIELHRQGKRIVLIIDEAQALPMESLETLRLMTNFETEAEKLLQIVLFAQPELDAKLQQKSLRQLTQRITFSHRLDAITQEDVSAYLCHRLAKAGHTTGTLFHPKAIRLIYRASEGIPRLINILGHKSLLVAYGKGKKQVSRSFVRRAIKDSKEMLKTKKCQYVIYGVFFALALFIFIILSYSVWLLH